MRACPYCGSTKLDDGKRKGMTHCHGCGFQFRPSKAVLKADPDRVVAPPYRPGFRPLCYNLLQNKR